MTSSKTISGEIGATAIEDGNSPAFAATFAWEDGTPSMLRCSACGAESPCPGILSVPNLRKPSEILTLHACPRCHSHFYHPTPDTNYAVGYPVLVAQYHRLQGVSLEFPLAVFSALPQKHGRLLDVGCGPGFLVDLWERLELGPAIGIEPSPVGKFASDDLHRRIRVLHLDEDTETPDHAFDVVLSTEVLEHVSYPVSFLSSLSKKVAPGGVLVFSTPDIGIIGPGHPAPSNLMEALSPGYHVTLFSEAALRRLLAELGWPEVHMITLQGHWIVYASRQPLSLAVDTTWAERMHRQYLELASRDTSLPPHARMIFSYRLFRKDANEGNWAQADALLPDIASLMPPGAESWLQPGAKITGGEFTDTVLLQLLRNNFHLPGLFFILGMRARNHLGDIASAIQFFLLASRLARLTTLRFLDDAFTKEIYWGALLNAGTALMESGDEISGTEILEKIGSSLDTAEKEMHRLLPQLKFATRARLEIFRHQVMRGQWQAAEASLSALQNYLAAQYPHHLLKASGWGEDDAGWPEGWNPFWYFYSEHMLLLNLGHNARAAQGFEELHSLCQKTIHLAEAGHFLPISREYADLARARTETPP